jgi:hypothetical protein
MVRKTHHTKDIFKAGEKPFILPIRNLWKITAIYHGAQGAPYVNLEL